MHPRTIDPVQGGYIHVFQSDTASIVETSILLKRTVLTISF